MQSFIKWVGGQRLLARRIARLLPRHRCYVEPFGGAAWVLFAKEPSAVEVYNDLDGRLVELFRSAKEHPAELARQLELLLPSRQVFEAFRQQPGLTELQRAARFYYVLKLSFGGKCKTFGPRKTEPTRLLLNKVMVDIERVRERLERVVIEHMDFERVLSQYGSRQTLFFVSPPYLGSRHYQVPFGPPDHERLKGALDRVAGSWILLYNDDPWVRGTYAGRSMFAAEACYTLGGRRQRARQLLITSYRPSRAALKAFHITPAPEARRGGSARTRAGGKCLRPEE